MLCASRFLSGLLLACLVACTAGSGSPGTTTRDRFGLARSDAGDLPPWAGQPTSWDKLETIETWLTSAGASRTTFWRTEGRLQLAEGRLDLSEFDRRADEAVLRRRKSAARSGFLLVIAEDEATDTQRRRAEAGLARTEGRETNLALEAAFALPRARWGASAPDPRNLTRNRARWSYITVHHSAHEEAGQGGATERDAVASLRSIQSSQMNGRGWGDIGYHFVIDPAGRVWAGRDLAWQGAHAGGVGGSNNVGNIGICLLGNFEAEKPTRAAVQSLERLAADLQRRFAISSGGIKGHRDWKGTACPGRHLLPYVRRLAN